MDQNRIAEYIRSLDCGHGEYLDRLGREARAAQIPLIRPETAMFLKTMVTLAGPQAILEIGTAVGYSALVMAQAMPEACHITTIENYEPRIALAHRHIKEAGEEARITLLEGDAGEILNRLTGTYDFVFMDAAKGQYLHWLPRTLELMRPGAVLISDNILQDGDILESRFAVTRRNRTIHGRMREYLYTLTHDAGLCTSIVPVGDGVAVTVKRKADDQKKSQER